MIKAIALLTLLALQGNNPGVRKRTEGPASPVDVATSLFNQVKVQLEPFLKGVVGGAVLGVLQEKAVDPALGGLTGNTAKAAEVAVYGGALYGAHTYSDHDLVQALKNPATLAGAIAGILGWHNYADILAWVKG